RAAADGLTTVLNPARPSARRCVMRERSEIGVAEAGDRGAHQRVRAGATVAQLLERGGEIVDALLGNARDLVRAGERRLMAGHAPPRRRKLVATLHQRLIDRLAARLCGQRGVVLRQRLQIIVLEVLHQCRHRLDLAHAFAHQEQLVDDEELRLSCQRWNIRHARIAVLAVTDRALFGTVGHALRARAVDRDSDRDGGDRKPNDERPPHYSKHCVSHLAETRFPLPYEMRYTAPLCSSDTSMAPSGIWNT